MFSLPSNHAFCKKYTQSEVPMKFFYFAIILFSLSLSAGPDSILRKLSVRGVNFTGSAEFVFQVIDKNGQVHWSNGADENTTISVPVRNGRYLVLLGGQNERITGPIVPGKIQALFFGYRST